MRSTKNIKAIEGKYDSLSHYGLNDAIALVKELKYSRFDESIDLAFNLNVDPKQADQNIRLTTTLPHGTGNEVIVLVLASGPKEKEALDSGADFVGNEEFLTKIKNGWAEVDKIVATPDLMPELGKLGKILGPKGLMPNPKSGTVTNDVGQAVQNLKAGQVELRVESAGIVHVSCGKTSFENQQIHENILAIFNAIQKARPSSVKGDYLQKISMSSTMGPAIIIDSQTIR